MINPPENLDEFEDISLVIARNVFIMIKEMADAQELPVSFPEPNEFVAEIQKEIDRIDVELLSRGVSP